MDVEDIGELLEEITAGVAPHVAVDRLRMLVYGMAAISGERGTRYLAYYARSMRDAQLKVALMAANAAADRQVPA